MKRVLFLLSRFLDGGIDTVLLDYLRNLSQGRDYCITLSISMGLGELEVFQKEIPQNVKVIHLVKDGWLTYWRKRKIKGRLPLVAKLYDEVLLAPVRRSIIERKLTKIVEGYDAVVDFDCCHYSYLKNVKTWKVAWFHFSFSHMMQTDRRRMKRIGKRLEHYDRVVTISWAMLEEGERLFPQLAGKWRLIYNAKDRERLERLAAEQVDDTRIEDKYILAVERLEESQKDLTTLIKAYGLMRQRYATDVRLYLLGKGRDEDTLRQLVTQLGLQGNVEFIGFHVNPYPWIRHAQIIAHSAKMEGLPTALIESLVMGKLIVATDCPTGPREILDKGKAGLLVSVGDVEAMAEAMYRLLTDESLKTQLQKDSKEHQRLFLFDSTRKLFDEVIMAEN